MSQEAIGRLNLNWQNRLLESKETISRLKELRGIVKTGLFRDLELGLADVPSGDDLPKNIFNSLKSFGVLDESLKGMVSMPLRRKDSSIVNFYFLSLNGKGDKILRKGGIVNLQAFSIYTKLVLVDNMDDYFAYFQHVKEEVVPVIQSDVMLKDFIDALKASNVKEVTLINDSPYWESLETKIRECDVRVFKARLPGNKGVAEFLKKHSGNRLIAHVKGETAKQLKKEKVESLKVQGSKDEEGCPMERPERFRVVEEPGEMRFIADDRQYRVRGFNRDGFEKIVQLSLEVDEKAFPDKIDLSRSQGRGRFANIAGSEFEMSPESIRDDLTFIYKTLDELQDQRFKEKAGINVVDKHIVTPKEESKAINNLTSRDLLNETLIKDTEKLGFVGEDINKKLYYLSATSRLTGKPLSVLVIASSGSGKSFGLSSIMELIPPDEMLKYSRITQHALYYKPEHDLRGKALYLEEITGMEEALKAIRMLLSSGELAVSVPEKDARTGVMRTVERRIKVDIPVLSSGVRDIWDDESLSRFLVTYNDDTLKQKQRILKAQAYQYSLEGEKLILYRKRILKKHRDMQKVLDPKIMVVNPFADKIMVNPNLHIVTRKQEQYLRIIYNIAFLRQHSREKKKAEDRFGNAFTYIEARKEDIETANEIAGHVFQYARGDLTKRLYDAFQMIESYCSEQVKEKRIGLYELKFSRREIRDFAGWEMTTAKRILDELESLEYIRKLRGSMGKKFLYTLVPYDTKSANMRDLNLLSP